MKGVVFIESDDERLAGRRDSAPPALQGSNRAEPSAIQKRFRLQEARRLMLSDGLDAAEAAFRVGYESPSQFGREYRRLFGTPPRQDVTALTTAGKPAERSSV
jgi:AraC-like DNA-binding protein